jgi:hypothetical protein
MKSGLVMKLPQPPYVNPNTPFRLFRAFGRPWGVRHTYPDYIAMPTDGLRKMAVELLEDPATRPVFEKAGIHGDIGPPGEAAISDFIEKYVAAQGWEKPDPANLVISTALARQLAAGGIAHKDTQSQLAFIDDKRCDGLDLIPKRDAAKQFKKLTASEVVPILHWIEGQEALKAPWTALRSKHFTRGQSFFQNESDAARARTIALIPGQIAIHKYALGNRKTDALTPLIDNLCSMYAVGQLDHFDEPKAISWMTIHYQGYVTNDLDKRQGA